MCFREVKKNNESVVNIRVKLISELKNKSFSIFYSTDVSTIIESQESKNQNRNVRS